MVSARGDEGIARVPDLAGGHGTHVVLECARDASAHEQATGIVQRGGIGG
ncbi:hypothetical protein ACIRD6_31440 [Streptomyces sp. NPDC102473]